MADARITVKLIPEIDYARMVDACEAFQNALFEMSRAMNPAINKLREMQFALLPPRRCDQIAEHAPHPWNRLVDGELATSRCDGELLRINQERSDT